MRNRNYRLGVINGWFGSIGDTCLNSGIVLAPLASQLGASNTLVGLIPALMSCGYSLPQLFVAGKVRERPLKLPIYKSSAWLRSSAFLLLVTASVLVTLWSSRYKVGESLAPPRQGQRMTRELYCHHGWAPC
ncbi:hypothetical protein [Deinococcus deserti]|uniref:Uncharacterized protein n=1 Tax=Deinococcus deserti (strain DSM 17065 / CIP 109153 / LMG 22923 / VCD115) TaxID=546414 RepID=C1D4A0_DEIDV|nr:hypothetical protein [Deinococcus deserti]ACO47981.1 Hypothetical protein Deide_3p00553 [Deinococcus deserti VCD115]